MIDPVKASKQIKRMAGLNFFPREDESVKELRLALETARSEAIAERVVTDWVGIESDAPKPAQLRSLVHEQNEKQQQREKKCERCSGCGWLTAWYLVTYKGNSFMIAKSERLDFTPGKENEESLEFSRRLENVEQNKPYQTVLTAAVPCSCRKPQVAA